MAFFLILRSNQPQAPCEPHSAKMKTFLSQLFFAAMLLASFCFGISPAFAGHEGNSHLLFTENKGQWESNILFQTDFRGGRLFLEKNDFMYVFYHPDDFAYLHPRDGKVTSQMRLHAVKVELQECLSSL